MYLLGEQGGAPSLVAAAAMDCGEESAECFFSHRGGLDGRQCGSHVVLHECVWLERCRYGLLWIVCFSRPDDLPDCKVAQWLSLIGRELANGPALSFLDRCGVLWVLCITPFGFMASGHWWPF